ncbi:MAG: type VII toxin-antitoxin system MntA family adenylyltransferase antitoxin [Myxococcota bacterium]
MERTDLEQRLRGFFAERDDGIVCAYLFGSRARGRERPSSDVDLGVLFETPPERTFEGMSLVWDLERDLEAILRLPVQVVALNEAPPDLVHRVLRDDVLVCDRDPSRRMRFEVRRRNEYWDLLPVLEEYRRGGAGR